MIAQFRSDFYTDHTKRNNISLAAMMMLLLLLLLMMMMMMMMMMVVMVILIMMMMLINSFFYKSIKTTLLSILAVRHCIFVVDEVVKGLVHMINVGIHTPDWGFSRQKYGVKYL